MIQDQGTLALYILLGGFAVCLAGILFAVFCMILVNLRPIFGPQKINPFRDYRAWQAAVQLELNNGSTLTKRAKVGFGIAAMGMVVFVGSFAALRGAQ